MWQKGFLGANSPQALVDTIIVLNGLCFALRSRSEHRQLRSYPCQIQLIEKPGQRPYLEYTEDVSKNRQGGLKGRKLKPKVVRHHDNPSNPDRCFVKLFKSYQSVLPVNRPNDAFYFHPLPKPRDGCWFTTKPIGHNDLQGTVARLCANAGITGFRSNHSLRATTATRLYQGNVDEQLIMERTGHRSLKGVREYKRTSDKQKEHLSDLLNSTSETRKSVALLATIDRSARDGQTPLPSQALQLNLSATIQTHTQAPCPGLVSNNSLSMFQKIMPPNNFSSCSVTINNFNNHT